MLQTKWFQRVLTLTVFFSLILSPQVILAGENFKAKIQKRLTQNSIQFQQGDQRLQYEPYYQQERQAAAPASQVAGNERADISRANKPCLEIDADSAVADRESRSSLSRYAIYQSKYDAELEENVVTVKGNVVFQVFEKGWTQLPLVRSDVGLIDVSVNRGSAFVTTENGKYYLMIDKPGRYTLNIEFLIKANRERENGPGQFTFEMMPAPISQFEFMMAETGVDIFVDPAIKVEVKKEGAKTVAWAVMPNTPQVTARWTKEVAKQEIKAAKLEPKVYAENMTYASVGEGVMRCQTTVSYSILQSEVSEFRLALPKDVSVLDVQGRDLRDWKVSSDEKVQYLDVYVNFGVKGGYVLNISYEKNVGEGSAVVEVPALQAVGVERETGYFGVAARTNVELALNKSQHATAIDVKELPSTVWNNSTNPILLAFKYLNHPVTISIQVTRHEELPVLVAAVDSAQAMTLYTPEGKMLTKVEYAVRNNVKQFLHMSLPKGAVLWSAFVAGKPVKPAKDKNDSILIPLEKSQLQGENLKNFQVEVVYLQNNAKLSWSGRLGLAAPTIDIPISQFSWAVSLPWEYRFFNFGGDVHLGQRQVFHTGGRVDTQYEPYYQDRKEAKSRLGAASQYAPQQVAQSFSKVAADEAAGGMTGKGILPIRIEIPQQGQTLHFSKLLVTENESPGLTMNYFKTLRRLESLGRLLIFVALIILVVRVLRRAKVKKG